MCILSFVNNILEPRLDTQKQRSHFLNACMINGLNGSIKVHWCYWCNFHARVERLTSMIEKRALNLISKYNRILSSLWIFLHHVTSLGNLRILSQFRRVVSYQNVFSHTLTCLLTFQMQCSRSTLVIRSFGLKSDKQGVACDRCAPQIKIHRDLLLHILIAKSKPVKPCCCCVKIWTTYDVYSYSYYYYYY